MEGHATNAECSSSRANHGFDAPTLFSPAVTNKHSFIYSFTASNKSQVKPYICMCDAYNPSFVFYVLWTAYRSLVTCNIPGPVRRCLIDCNGNLSDEALIIFDARLTMCVRLHSEYLATLTSITGVMESLFAIM